LLRLSRQRRQAIIIHLPGAPAHRAVRFTHALAVAATRGLQKQLLLLTSGACSFSLLIFGVVVPAMGASESQPDLGALAALRAPPLATIRALMHIVCRIGLSVFAGAEEFSCP